MIKKAWAVWKGGIKDGGGRISTETGAATRHYGSTRVRSVPLCLSCLPSGSVR